MESINIKIDHKGENQKGKFTLFLNEEEVGFMHYEPVNDKTVNIPHTEVDPSQRGKGLAQHLVSAGVMLARENNWKIQATCPYARAILSKTEEYNDVFVEIQK